MQKTLTTIILAVSGIALAGEPAAKVSQEPPVIPLIGQAIDPAKPAFVPKFLELPKPSQLQQQRDSMIQYSGPPVVFGVFIPMRPGCYGYFPCGSFYR